MSSSIHRRSVLGGLSAAAIMTLLRSNYAAALQPHNAPALATRQSVTLLIPNRLYRIGCTVRAERLSWLAEDIPGGFEPLNAYLLLDQQNAVFIDMGAPIMLPAIREAIDTVVGSRRAWASYTRNEADCIGNMGWILGSCPNPTLLFGGAGGILEWINDPAVSIMEVRDFLGRVPIVESRNGTTNRIGELSLEWLDAGLKQMLMTQWAFEPSSGCLFTSDAFGFRHLRSADQSMIVENARRLPAPQTVARELVARIRALHRRMHRPQSDRMLRIYIDPAQRCLIGATGERTSLTEAEMSALDTLLDAGGVSVSREWLSRIALKRPLHADDRAVDQLVMKLRRKLASQGASDRVILSARRQGYMIADPSLFRAIPRPTPANSNAVHLNGTESVGAQ